MRDYKYIDGRGKRVFVAQMKTEDIHFLLNNDFDVVVTEDPLIKDAAVERLKLELEIRALGLGEVD
jgi:hypothetical protein